MITPGSNPMLEPPGSGATLTQEMSKATVRPEVCTRE
jgi:hypothetical protein